MKTDEITTQLIQKIHPEKGKAEKLKLSDKPIQTGNQLTDFQGVGENTDQTIVSSGKNSSRLIPKPNFAAELEQYLDTKEAWEKTYEDLSTGAAAGASPFSAIAAKLHGQNSQLTDLVKIARLTMKEHNLIPDFSPAAMRELAQIKAPAFDSKARDLRSLQWVSIDNDDSRDLDQLSVAQELPNGDVKILVAIADVDALIPKGSALDQQAAQNTASVYTPAKVFPMLPEKLSTDLTSLNPGVDRLAVVTEMVIAPDGSIRSSDVYKAMVNNHAKLAYNSVAAWLEGKGQMPDAMKAPGIADQIRIHDRVAQQLKNVREQNGAIELEGHETKAVVENGKVTDIYTVQSNRATEIIENLMIAANGVTARFLKAKNFPVFERIVEKPQYWEDIVSLASYYGVDLPEQPDSKALNEFLKKRKEADPVHFQDLCLDVLKLIGRGQYVVERPGEAPTGHFGLAVRDYTHSTAPNRRYPDLITQRLLKAAIDGKPCPYSMQSLDQIADRCSVQEVNIKKTDRQLVKCAAASYLSSHIGERFDAIVTEVNDKGTWVRLLKPPVEGRLFHDHSVAAGDQISVKLMGVNVEKGFIDLVPMRQNIKKAA